MTPPKITLEAARVNAGLSQTDAALALGISRDTISNYERGKTEPSWQMLTRMGELYGYPIDFIRC